MTRGLVTLCIAPSVTLLTCCSLLCAYSVAEGLDYMAVWNAAMLQTDDLPVSRACCFLDIDLGCVADHSLLRLHLRYDRSRWVLRCRGRRWLSPSFERVSVAMGNVACVRLVFHSYQRQSWRFSSEAQLLQSSFASVLTQHKIWNWIMGPAAASSRAVYPPLRLRSLIPDESKRQAGFYLERAFDKAHSAGQVNSVAVGLPSDRVGILRALSPVEVFPVVRM